VAKAYASEQLPQGYHTVVGEGGMTLSGGQRQRISLVRAILKDAPIIILDEATSLVDPENEARIQDAIAGLLHPANGEPKTIVAIAHRLGTVYTPTKLPSLTRGASRLSGRTENYCRATNCIAASGRRIRPGRRIWKKISQFLTR